jgi:hypothetical protein
VGFALADGLRDETMCARGLMAIAAAMSRKSRSA